MVEFNLENCFSKQEWNEIKEFNNKHSLTPIHYKPYKIEREGSLKALMKLAKESGAFFLAVRTKKNGIVNIPLVEKSLYE